MSSIVIPIKGRDWKFILLADKRFNKLHNSMGESDAVAMTMTTTYEVHFRKSDWDLITIRHELLHVLFTAGLSSSAELTAEQVQEICAEIVAHHTPDIVLWTDRIAERFLGRE